MIVLDFSKNKNELIDTLNSAKGEWVKEILSFLQQWWNNEDYFISSTSGSTGAPKEIKIKKTHAINSARATSNYFKFAKDQNALLCMNTKFIGAKMMIVRALINNMKLYCIEATKFPLEDIDDSIQFHFAPMLAIQVYNSIDNPKINNFKNILIGGSKVDSKLRNKILKTNGNFYSSYGMTETVSHIALQKLHGVNDVYQTLEGISISTDKDSCLIINAPDISDEIIYTNDIVEISNSNKLKILGRKDNIINSGGIKLFPEKIEEKLFPYISSSFFISSLPDEELGEKVVLIIEGSSDTHINLEVLKRYEKPKELFFLKEFVRNDNNKIIREKTKALVKG